ncbi:MAG: protoheme IX farnesyltransferase [Bdellovibrionales bacterium]|nr:protoheme IX farnesyltransferase [Bdellovibrionales bacterium]
MAAKSDTNLPVSRSTYFRAKLGLFKELSKSGIVALVLISVFAGYLAGRPFDRPLDGLRLVITLVGVLLLSSGSSALNQYQDREMDARMPRTAKRPIPSGRISERSALAFSWVSIFLGMGIVFALDPVLALLGGAAVVLYNGLYTLWWKRRWSFAAVPGAIPGALPILMGYLAANGDIGAPGGWYLFGLLFMWQMPHFWSLALRYREDYREGRIPTLPVTLGSRITFKHISLWCLAYVAVALAGPLFLDVGPVYLASAVLMSAKLLWELRRFAPDPEGKGWLPFFLWVNFSLLVFLGAAVVDLWSIYLWIPLTR